MAYCPNCRKSVEAGAESCASCGALFTGGGWAPVDSQPLAPFRSSAAGVILKLGIASVALPGVAFLVGLLLSSVIPGCHCEEGAGCRGCGANDLVAFLLLGGFVGALAALITVLPVSLALAGVVGLISSRRSQRHGV